MKKILVLILIGLLAACESSALIQEEGNGTVLVLTYVEGLEASFEGFFKRPFEVVRSLDGIVLSEYERIVVLYDDNLNLVFPPLMFGGSRLSYSQIVTFDHHEGVELTMVYLDGLDDYQEMFDVLDHRIYDIRTPQVVYELYPLQGISVNVTIDNVDRSLLLQSLPATAELAPSGDNLRWFYASEEVYLFVGENIPTYLSKYAEQLSELNEEAIVIVNERGQRLVIGRALGPFASEYYESFVQAVAQGIQGAMKLDALPPVGINFPQQRIAPPEVCYTKDLRGQPFGPHKDSTTVSHEIPVTRLPSTGTIKGLVVMIGFNEFQAVISEERYQSIIETANDSSDAFYLEMSEGQLNFEWEYYPEVVYVPFFLDPSINAGTPGYMDLINDHVYAVLDQVESDFDLTDINVISFFWPLGLPDYVGGGVAEQLDQRMTTKRGNIYNYILQRVVTDQKRMDFVVTHELAHNLGLTDTYVHPWVPEYVGKSSTFKYGHWDLMAAPNELKAWHRWIMSWMPDEQVHCLPHGRNQTHDVFIEPLNHTTADTRQIVISLSDTQAISIELRGPGQFCPSGCDQNVLVTYIDTMIGNGHGPLEILRPTRSFQPNQSDSLLQVGESVQFRNISITHSERFAMGSIIQIRFD
jgi:M6 family metalloprotease-like protein